MPGVAVDCLFGSIVAAWAIIMEPEAVRLKLTSWWAERQGLLRQQDRTAQETLEAFGWLRSVGGMAPYLSLFVRSGISKAAAEKELAEKGIHELPSARGCVHFLPKRDYRLGLSLASCHRSDSDIGPATKHFGLTQEELERLCQGVLAALEPGPLDPKALKQKLGELVRTFPPEGKKYGLTTSLPMALGILQRRGQIRRIPFDGRLDGERYLYAAWPDGPMEEGPLNEDEALVQLASLYWDWLGAASLRHFKWFSGVSVTKCRKAVESLGLVTLEGSELLIKAADTESLSQWNPPSEPVYRFVSSLDSILMARRDLASIISPKDQERPAYKEAGVLAVGGLSDVSSHMILDRGTIAGFWDYDPAERKIIAHLWRESTQQYREELDRTETFIRDEVGDARSFSLDSPSSRQGRLSFLRSQQ